MTQEEKDLLLRDLCARLPYGVMCSTNNGSQLAESLGIRSRISKLLAVYANNSFGISLDNGEYMPNEYPIEEVKPYLRPMSSMTEEETEIFNSDFGGIEDYYNSIEVKRLDFLNAHHFDYRGLIDKGLAIAITEDNNPYKD